MLLLVVSVVTYLVITCPCGTHGVSRLVTTHISNHTSDNEDNSDMGMSPKEETKSAKASTECV